MSVRFRFLLEDGEREFLVIGEDVQGVIEPSPDGDSIARWWQGSSVERAFELNELRVQSNGKIVIDTASGFEAKDVVEV